MRFGLTSAPVAAGDLKAFPRRQAGFDGSLGGEGKRGEKEKERRKVWKEDSLKTPPK